MAPGCHTPIEWLFFFVAKTKKAAANAGFGFDYDLCVLCQGQRVVPGSRVDRPCVGSREIG